MLSATINVINASLPVRIGVPISQSENLLTTANLRVRDPLGTVIASAGAFEVLARWGAPVTDTTQPVMIVLVTFKPTAGQTGNYTLDASGAAHTPSPILVTNGANDILVQTGALDARVTKANADLLSQFVVGGTERLAAGTKPRLITFGDASLTKTVGQAAAGQNQITVNSTLGLSIGTQIKLKFEAGHVVTQGGAVVVDEAAEYFNGSGIGRQFRIEPGGANQEDFTLYFIQPAGANSEIYWQSGQGPTLSHVAGVTVRDQTLEADHATNGNYTISAISGSTLTLNRNLPVAIYGGTQLEVAGGGSGGVTAAFLPTSTTIERQTDHLVEIVQRGKFQSNVNPFCEIAVCWSFYAGQDFALVTARFNNYSKDTAVAAGDANFSELYFSIPTAVAASGSDAVLTNAAAVSRVQAGTTTALLSAGSFQIAVPEFAQKWPKGLTGSGTGFRLDIFPAGSPQTLEAARATSVAFLLGLNLSTPATLTSRPTNATLSPAYVVGTQAHRGATTIAATYSAGQFGGDPDMAEAANRTEQALAVMYDVSKAQPYGSTPALSATEWRNQGEYGIQYGWNMFGTFNWQDNPRNYNHYDTQYHTLIQFLRTGDIRALQIGSELARFMADYGTYQSRIFDGGNIYNQLQGIARFEDEDRRGPGFLSHSWFEGLWLYWALTGDLFVKEAVMLSIEGRDQNNELQPGCLMNWRWAPTGASPYPGGYAGDGASWDIFTLSDGERYIGWAILGLMAAYRYLGRSDILARAGQYVSCFTASEAAQGNHGYYIPSGFEDDNDPPADTGSRRKVAFVTHGYPLIGVIEYWKQTGSVTVRDYIARVGKAVIYGDAQAVSVRKDVIVQGGFTFAGKHLVTDGAYFWYPQAQTTLSGSLSAGATSLTLANGSKFLDSGGNFAIEEGGNLEFIRYTSRSGNTLNGLTRAQYGSTAQGFTTAAIAYPVPYPNDNDPAGGIAIDYLPVISTAAKISGDAVLSDAATRIFKDVSLYFGILGPDVVPTDRFFINLRTYGYPGSSVKNWGQRAYGLEQYLADILANAVPILSSISPATVTVGGAQFTLTVNGSQFVNGAVVRINGADRTTTFVSGTQLTATILAGDVATAGTRAITVFNPSPGGGLSNALTLTVQAPPAPAISSISPQQRAAGSGGFTLTVNGSNFAADAVVRWNGSDRATTFVSSTQLTATILAGDVATAGTATITVRNVADAQTSAGATFTINAAPPPGSPVIDSLAPSVVTAGSGAFVLTVGGSDFVSGAVVTVGGADRTTAFVSGTQLTVQVLASDIATGGSVAVVVRNPDTQTSNPGTLTVNNPAPTISSLSPATVTSPGGAFELTINGTGFVSGSVARVSGSDRTTTFVSSTQIRAQIFAGDVASAGSVPITVLNPAPGGGVSNTATLTVQSPPTSAPTISSLSPSSANAGSSAITLTVNGSGFVSGAVVRWNGSDRATTFISATQLTATIPATDLATAGPATVTVRNPDAQTSGGVAFTINEATNPVPTVSAISPSAVAPGSSQFTLTVNGSGFVSGAVVTIGGANRATTFVSATQLTAQVLASDIATAGTLAVGVTNPAPGGGSSATTSPLTVSNVGVGQPELTAGMTALRLGLATRQGNTFRQVIRLRSGGVAFNLTGVTGRLQARRGPADRFPTILLDLTSANGGVSIDPLDGKITLSIPAADSALMRFERARYDLTLTAADGTVVTVMEGEMQVRRRITIP